MQPHMAIQRDTELKQGKYFSVRLCTAWMRINIIISRVPEKDLYTCFLRTLNS